MEKKIMFVVNPKAGKKKGVVYKRKIEKMLEDLKGRALIEITAEEGPNSLFSLGKRAVQESFDILVSVGGDGTHNLLVNGMMAEAEEQGLPLGSLPKLGLIGAGTGNNFTKNLGIQASLNRSLGIISKGRTRAVDIGLLTTGSRKQYFINVVSFGFDGLVVATLKHIRGKHRLYRLLPKSLAYFLVAAYRIFLGLPSYRLITSHSGLDMEQEVHLLALLNGPTYGAIFRIAPNASLSDGLLDACLISRANRLKAVELLFRAIWGKHVGLSQAGFFNFSSLKIASPDPLPCEIDGEVMPIEKEYQVSIIPGALNVFVP